MRSSIFSDFDPSFAILAEDVASDVWVTALALNNYTIVDTLCDQVVPDFGLARIAHTSDFDAIFMTLFNFIVLDDRLVTVDFDADLIQIEVVPEDL